VDHSFDPETWLPYCPYYAVAGDILTRRWAPMVLRALVTGPKRFGEIAAAIPDMTDKLLSQRLKDLGEQGLVERFLGSGRPPRVEYRLTEKGAALGEILLDINRWALKWIDPPAKATE
jgi:DNA-binding HxlR family transcriptional regulator